MNANPRHHTIDDIALRSARCVRSLAREDPEKINHLNGTGSPTWFFEPVPYALRDQSVDRLSKLVVSTVPVQTIWRPSSLTSSAQIALRSQPARAQNIPFALRPSLGTHPRRRLHFADARIGFVLACVRVEIPLPCLFTSGIGNGSFRPPQPGYHSVRLCHKPDASPRI